VIPPLQGIRIADFSRILAGPLATMVLADLGADVVKVEQPGTGDDTRHWRPPTWNGTSTYFLAVNRNKHGVTLDLNNDDDLAAARQLALGADVVVENFRPGWMTRKGLGYDELSAQNPALIYCSISAFGPNGPAADIAGYDLLVQAMSGLMHITGTPDSPPTKVGVAVVDVVTGLYALAGILAAVAGRERDPNRVGTYIEVSLFDAALASLVNQASAVVLAGADPSREGNRHPSIAPYEVVQSADRPFVIAAANDRLFARLCDVIARPDLAADKRYRTNEERRTNVDDLIEQLEATLTTRPSTWWVEQLQAAGVPAGPINTIPEAVAWAQDVGIDPLTSDDTTGYTAVRSPIRLNRQPLNTCTTPPALS
jgi:crotonobetainyl-CoA:carnitine CoA-transferase CaiB-like acyl-CoA transferase